jgi:class 3 adenylate cyclase
MSASRQLAGAPLLEYPAMTLDELVREFANNVAAQSEAIFQAGAAPEDTHGDRYIAAFQDLRARGDEGREALCVLLKHPKVDVKATAAAFLLRYRTAEAKAVLEDVAMGEGLIAFGAQQALKGWEDGTWALDPE